MNDKLIKDSACENAYKKAKADLDKRVLSMQQSANEANVDPIEVGLIETAYKPLADYIARMVYLEQEDPNKVIGVLNRFTSTLTTEAIATLIRDLEAKGSKMSVMQLVPLVQTIVDDFSGRIEHNFNAMLMQRDVQKNN